MSAPSKLPRGVSLYRGRYRVRIIHEGRTVAFGMFDTLTDARAALSIARADAARRFFACQLSTGPPARLRPNEPSTPGVDQQGRLAGGLVQDPCHTAHGGVEPVQGPHKGLLVHL